MYTCKKVCKWPKWFLVLSGIIYFSSYTLNTIAEIKLKITNRCYWDCVWIWINFGIIFHSFNGHHNDWVMCWELDTSWWIVSIVSGTCSVLTVIVFMWHCYVIRQRVTSDHRIELLTKLAGVFPVCQLYLLITADYKSTWYVLISAMSYNFFICFFCCSYTSKFFFTKRVWNFFSLKTFF